MTSVAEKNIAQLKQDLVKNLTVDFFEDKEIEAIIEEIESHDERLRQKMFALCSVLSGASSSLVPRSLKRVRSASRYLPLRDLERWITHAFDLLDSEGFEAYTQFTSKVDEEALTKFQHPEGLRLQDVAPVLEAYLKGISGSDLRIKSDEYSFTDTSTIFLPPVMDRFKDDRKNFLLYKMAAVHKWAQIALGTLTPDEDTVLGFMLDTETEHPDIAAFFSLFPERELALDIYNILESFRIELFLHSELPGLMRKADAIRAEIYAERVPPEALPEKAAAVEGLYQYYLEGEIKGSVPSLLKTILQKIPLLAEGPEESMRALSDIYDFVCGLSGRYAHGDISIFLGRIEPEKVSRHLLIKKHARRKRIEGIISKLINMPDLVTQMNPSAESRERPVDPNKEYLLIRGKLVEVDNDVRDYILEKGGVPGGVLVEGSSVGAGCPLTLSDFMDRGRTEETETQSGGIKYDEWDYRRGGYKRRWSSLFERDIHPGKEPFVEMTLQRYSGYVKLLRKQFELLKREQKLLKRQMEGDNVDIDATVEAFADICAGLSPSENLFMRLDHQERNIAVLFLLDMSGSTKGWVNLAEKEALVLMCEALESLGDRYAIYGFSGMTRSRCEYYRIKSFDELYADAVKKRIAGIEPKDYTRMGPPIRHSTHILGGIEARTKLLITLSDGKPEDWDAYKGEFAVEDTRKALIEAREKGIHSFCITIDKEASTYLPHMYGEGNYTVIDDISKLPSRITEIYRRLTT